MLGTAILTMFPGSIYSTNPELKPLTESANDYLRIDGRDLKEVLEGEVGAEKAASYGGGYGNGAGYGGGYDGGYGGDFDSYGQCPYRCMRSILHSRRCRSYHPSCGGYYVSYRNHPLLNSWVLKL